MYNVIEERIDTKKKLMTVKEFCSEYGIGLNSGYEMVKDKKAPVIRIGKKIMLVRSKVDFWIESKVTQYC